jgi:hypothetical protein
MASPLSADRLVSALRAEGVRVVERSGWRTHNRNSKGRWDNLNGIVIHHTAGRNSLNLCWNGTSSLPGPLCHTHLAKDGAATMVGYGRTNHAGTFAQNAHDAVVAESRNHPRPDSSEPVDGNRHYYGIEIENLGNGSDPYPEVQYDAAVRWATAICRAHGWSADSVIGHKEGTRRKIDPSFDMNTFRAEVAERLKHPAGWSPGDEEDGLSGLTKDDIYAAVWRTDKVTAPDTAGDRATNKTWQPESYLRDIGNRVRAMDTRLSAQQAAINELVKTVAQLAANTADLDAEALVARIESEIEKVTVRLEVADA